MVIRGNSRYKSVRREPRRERMCTCVLPVFPSWAPELKAYATTLEGFFGLEKIWNLFICCRMNLCLYCLLDASCKTSEAKIV